MLLPMHSVKRNGEKLSIGYLILIKDREMNPFSGWDIVQSVAPIPSFKFVHTTSSRLVSGLDNSKKYVTCILKDRLESLANWDDVTTNIYRNMLFDIPGYKPAPLFSRLYARGVQSQKFYQASPIIIKKIETRWGNSCMGQPIDIVNSFVQGIANLD